MTTPSQTEKPKRRISDSLLLLLIVLIGFCCMLFSGEMALRLAPIWSRSDTNMNSGIDPDENYKPGSVDIEPVLAEILTPPVWWDVFLTPDAEIPANAGDSSQPLQETAPPPTDAPVTVNPPTNATPTVTPTVTPATYPPPPPPTKPNPPPPNPTDIIVNLGITKTDGASTYTAGSSILYTVIVTNYGPNAVTGAIITDNKPNQVDSWIWDCTTVTNASGCTAAPSNSNNFTDTVNIQNGGSIRYTVTAQIRPGATGLLVNTASVSVPSGYNDPNTGNNSETDTNTLIASVSADLDITKTSVNTSYTAGGTVAYSITVTNNGSVPVTNATLSDAKPAQVSSWGWCVGSPCTPTMTNTDLSTSITLTSGASITYNVTANINGPTLTAANLVNTATVTLPVGYIDPDTSTNTDTSNTVTIPPYIDLSINKTSSSSSYAAGQLFTLSPPLYVVTVTNNSTFDLTDVTVTDTKPSQILGWLWTCTTTNATCTSYSSDIFTDFSDTTVSIQAGGTITYRVGALVIGDPGNYIIGNLENQAKVSAPMSFVDTIPGNNDSPIVAHAPSNPVPGIEIGLPDGDWYSPGEGGSITFAISPSIQADGTNTPDFVFYERLANPTRVEMDWVIVQISSDGSTWHEVFNWGNGNPDKNTNVDTDVISGTEVDNRVFLLVDNFLYNDMGVTIDIDAISGISTGVSYSWIKVISPASPDGDSAEINAIQPWYP